MMNKSTRKITLDTLAYLVLGIGAVMVMIPIVWMLSTSLKDNQQIFRFPPELLPNPPVWENYGNAITYSGLPFLRFFANSLFITLTATVGAVLSAFVVGFSFARLHWRGRDAVFALIVLMMVIPIEVVIVPKFILFNTLGWIDTYLPLILPSFFGGAFHIFIARQYMMGIPREMDEAAKIDGCNIWDILWKIILPQSKPVVLAIAIYSIQDHWNAFLEPLIYISSTNKFTVSLGLSLFNGQYGTQWGLLMAAAVLVMSPILLLFICAQNYFIQGVVIAGVKG